jgi:hypothetical protein
MKLVVIAVMAILSGAAGGGEEPQAILKSSDVARGGGLPGITWRVKVTAEDGGSTQLREVVVKASGDSSVVDFVAPPKVKGQKMLMVGHNLWFVQPGLQRPVPISPRQRLSGQAANGDIASTNYATDYTARLLRDDALDGRECFVLALTANNKSATYDKIVYWISKAPRLGMKAEFLSVSGKPLKTAVFEYRNRMSYRGATIPFVSHMVITDALTAHNVTTLEYDDIKVGAVPASDFDLNLIVR